MAKAGPSHPAYTEMILVSLKELKERKGSSFQAIKKHMCAKHKLVPSGIFNSLCNRAAHKLIKAGEIKNANETTGAGKLSGRLKCCHPEKKPKVLKPKAKKPAVKKPAAKKVPAAKKPAAKKGTKSPGKKTTTKKTTTKKTTTKKTTTKKTTTKKITPKKAGKTTKKTTKKPSAKKTPTKKSTAKKQ